MKLKDCTKDELIFIIKRLQFYMLAGDDYYVRRALCDVEEERQDRKHAEERRLLEFAAEMQREYVRLLEPYDGKPFIEVPDSILERAEVAMKAAQEANQKWNRLMGIRPTPVKK